MRELLILCEARPRLHDIRGPSENIDTVLSSNFTNGRIVGKETVPLVQLVGGVRMDDPADSERVKQLARQIASPDGYFARIIVNTDNEVVEGQHRLSALRLLDIRTVPILRVGERTEGFPVQAMEDAVRRVGGLHPEQVRQCVAHAADMIREAGSPQAALETYEFTRGYERHFEAAIKAAS